MLQRLEFHRLPAALLVLVLQPPLSAFDPAKDLPISVLRGALVLETPKGVHLKVAAFKVALRSKSGALKTGKLPSPDGTDEAGDPIWRGVTRVPLIAEGLSDPVELVVTYQPCTEGPEGLCYLPQRRVVTARAADLKPR